jgi:hypothetical protein
VGDALEDRDFDQVQAGSFLSCRCSPDLGGDRAFRGIRLAAPRRVLFTEGERADPIDSSFARVIVCGSSLFDAGYLGLGQRFLPYVVLVAVDAATHRAFAGTMTPVVPTWEPELPPEALAGRTIGNYFNPNLAAALGLPEAEAEYLVYATLGAYVSNVVRVGVRRREREIP